MEGGYGDKPALGKAAQVVVDKAKLYYDKRGYPKLNVWSKSLVELDLLKRQLGGTSYPHLGGYVWVMGKRSELIKLRNMLDVLHPDAEITQAMQAIVPVVVDK